MALLYVSGDRVSAMYDACLDGKGEWFDAVVLFVHQNVLCVRFDCDDMLASYDMNLKKEWDKVVLKTGQRTGHATRGSSTPARDDGGDAVSSFVILVKTMQQTLRCRRLLK
jgi:hypothetical protein